jgi:antirestriction protein ArdC
MRKQATPEQKAKAAARREKFQGIAKAVAAMTDEQRAQIVEKIGAVPTVEGRALSVFNSCLILNQNPEASMVGGFNQWITAGRVVRKGETGLMIFCPSKGKQSEAPEAGDLAEDKVRFFMGTVFDITQTTELEGAEAGAQEVA